MNNKGFTLVELLATIVLISVVMGIATYSIINVINASKEKSEKIFVDKLGTAIEGYLSVKGSSMSKADFNDEGITFTKCRIDTDDCEDKYKTEVSLYELETINLSKITEDGYKTIDKEKIVNPKTKENCLLNGKNPQIRVFRDSDHVYYYYMSLSSDNNSCHIDNTIKTNIPENVCSVLNGNYDTEGLCKLNEE